MNREPWGQVAGVTSFQIEEPSLCVQADCHRSPPEDKADRKGMSEVRPISLDEMLAERLSLSLGVPVAATPSSPTHSIQRAVERSGKVQVHLRAGSDQCELRLGLPAGGVAIWQCDRDQVERVSRHAEAVLELESSKNENRQLLAEVDSLTNQVVQNFEELSLIRTLASSLDLPQNADETDEFVLASLRPLASGVGAVSLAAVLTDDSGTRHRSPIWIGPRLMDDDSIFGCVDVHAAEVHKQPLVRNSGLCDLNGPFGDVTEMVMVECSSEGRLHGWVLACNRLHDDIDDVPWAQLGFTTVQASLMETATSQLAAQLNNIRLLQQKEELFTDVIRALVSAVEARDPYTCGHSERVASFARSLASNIGFSPAECERIYLTGLLHDVGKIAVPDGILQKPSRLNPEERAIIETHADSGWRILQELDALQDVLPGVLYHHERWDGRGYPDKLEGKNIPIDGRVLAVCDSFDAMTSDRPYRKGMSIEDAVQILRGGAGKFWDPNLVEVFERNIDQIDAIRREHRPRRPATRPAPIGGRPVIGQAGISVSP